MSDTAEALKRQLEGLPTEERAEIALYLLNSLDDEDDGLDPAWEAEINRRIAAIEAGTVVGRPAEDVFAELRRKYP